MRSYHLENLGRVDGIVAREHEIPSPKPNDIVVRVRAVSLNRRDALILQGRYALPSKPGVIPISDGAGEVVAVGDAVTRFAVGDQVVGSYWPRWRSGRLAPDMYDQLGCTIDGMLTEYALLDEQWVARIPEQLGFEEAASLPCAAVTAWTALTGGEPLRPGDTVLTLGTGDVSLFALQFAKMMGCRVISTTSSQDKADRLKALGADEVVNYVDHPQWSKQVRELTGGAGVDLIVETMGHHTMDESFKSVGFYGQVVLLAASNRSADGTPRPYLEISDAAYPRTLATIRREFVGSRTDLETVLRAMAANGIRPVIDRRFDFADASAAFDYFLEGGSFGKVIIQAG